MNNKLKWNLTDIFNNETAIVDYENIEIAFTCIAPFVLLASM